jgi:hypothetical protein
MARRLRLVALLLALLVPALTAGPQQGDGQRKRERPSVEERWSQLSEEQRAELRRRYEAYRRLSPEERARLHKRARQLNDLGDELRKDVSPEVRARLDGMPPEQRERVWREHLHDRAREEGRHMRDRLPPELVEQLEAAPEGERARLLEDFHRKRRDKDELRALFGMARELGLSRDEIRRVKQAAPEERRRTLLAMQKRVAVQAVERHGLPTELSAAEWNALRELPPESFAPRWQALHLPAPWGPPPRRGAKDGPGRRGGDDRPPPPRDERLRKLMDLLRPDLQQRVEHNDLSRDERRRRVHEQVKQRTLAYLETTDLVAPDELARLRELEGREYMRAIQDLAHGLLKPSPGGEAGDRRRREERPNGRPGPKRPGSDEPPPRRPRR